MAKKKFKDLPPWMRALTVVGGMADLALRAAALVDAAKRDDEELNGPKALWLPALGVVNSMGLLPLAYFRWGRKDAAV